MIQDVTSGGVFFTPILDNMVRTFHKVPQVKTFLKVRYIYLGKLKFIKNKGERFY